MNKIQRHISNTYGTKQGQGQNDFPFGLLNSQGYNSFDCLLEAYSELWSTRKIEQQMMNAKNSCTNNCLHQLLPCYLEVVQEDFLNGGTTGLSPHVPLSYNSLCVFPYNMPSHPSLHYSNDILHSSSVL